MKPVSSFLIGSNLYGMEKHKTNDEILLVQAPYGLLPAQLTPSPVYPGLQVQVKERLVLVQYASSWQLCCPVLHSSTNQQMEVSYKNFFDVK